MDGKHKQSGTGAPVEEAAAVAANAADASVAPGPNGGDRAELERLVHELSVHQVELELQNEQLRETQALLEASRDRYADLYDHAPVAYITCNLAGVVMQANRLASELMQTPAAGLCGLRLVELVAPADRPRLHGHVSALLRGGGDQALEVRLTRPERPSRWAALQMTLVVGDGEPQYRAAMLDISDRVRMQKDAARLAAIVASSDEAIVSRDVVGRVTSWNAAAERMFGRNGQQMIGATLDELVPAARRDEEDRLLRLVRAGHSTGTIETERLDFRGRTVPLAMGLSPIRDANGTVEGSAMIARDISERRHADEALRRRLRQLDTLAQAGQALIMGAPYGTPMRHELFDRVGQTVGSEIRLHYSTGETPQTLALVSAHGLPEGLLPSMARQQVAESLCGMVVQRHSHVVVDRLQSSALRQAALLKQAGARCYAGFPLLAQDHVYGVAAFASTSRDHFVEGDLQVMQTVCDQVSAMLERARLLEELHASEQSLRRADRAKDEFIATLAHELRNPLAPIRNAVGILRQLDVSAPRQLVWCRDVIERQVGQMTHLLEDLLDVSRVTRNKIDLRLQPLDLRLPIEQAIETLRPALQSQRQELTVQLPREPVRLMGDPTRLTQVFANLLQNASKYTDAGGRIAISVEQEGTTALVRVRDNGIGIPPQQVPRVFDMFSQLVPALERSAGGLGIGLALTRGLVELHGGAIEASSDGPGRGSEFRVRLPLSAAEPAAAAEAPTREGPVPSARRVLVVDDNADAAESLAMVLSLQGHETRTAFDGQRALAAAAEWPPDVAVLDIGLPDMSGYELARRLRAQSRDRVPLLVACTGWGQPEDRQRARDAGFDHHLVKPVDPDALLRLLGRGGAPSTG